MTILSVDELRGFLDSSLGDDELQVLLDATETEIEAYAGAAGNVVQLIDGGWSKLALSRRAASVSAVTETSGSTTTTLAGDDYRLRAEGYVIERLNTGTNRRRRWHGLVSVTYAVGDDEALRKSVQVELIRLDLEGGSGIKSRTIGDYSESFATEDRSTEERRSDILARLNPEPGALVVGGPSVAVW